MTIDGILETILFLTALIIAYHHFGYPILLRRLARRRRSKCMPVPDFEASALDLDELPSITVIVPAHNEARYIARKIKNLAALSYPPHRLKIVIAFDGCTDDTKQLAERALADSAISAQVTLVDFAVNIGKIAVLNSCVSAAITDLVALSDTSAQVSDDALLRAAAHFMEASVGVVCGTYMLQSPLNEGERAYWRYQVEIKAGEAALAAPMGAHGAFYLFRRQTWTPLAPDTINDDFIIPMRIVAAGYRAVYDEHIVATELEQTTVPQEFRRRARIGAGNLQQSLRLVELMDPRRGWLAFLFLSGKGLRPFIPFLGLTALAATVGLAVRGHGLARAFLITTLPIVIAALSLPRWMLAVLPSPLAWLRYFTEGHAASLVGALQYLAGRSAGAPHGAKSRPR